MRPVRIRALNPSDCCVYKKRKTFKKIFIWHWVLVVACGILDLCCDIGIQFTNWGSNPGPLYRVSATGTPGKAQEEEIWTQRYRVCGYTAKKDMKTRQEGRKSRREASGENKPAATFSGLSAS